MHAGCRQQLHVCQTVGSLTLAMLLKPVSATGMYAQRLVPVGPNRGGQRPAQDATLRRTEQVGFLLECYLTRQIGLVHDRYLLAHACRKVG